MIKKAKTNNKLDKCKHVRQIKFYPKEVTWFNVISGSRGKHETVVVEGCLDCSKLWVRDYGE